MNWYIEVLKKYAVFEGRARRKEYWMFALVNVVIAIVLAIVDAVLGTQIPSVVYALAVLLPGLGVSVRRLHDTGRTGWWLLIGIIPLVGAIVLLIFTVSEGTKGQNEYGADPKEGEYSPAHS
ncbi:DUF805 domain-containing protein [Streptomyces shenzhenensis]|uniref:DUF805 domain-containing protein n=1 Tax=Streptomyces shenzhenensis TaxID=943815 RepID=A0A3M0HYM8_9ACTN|nr:DUF805 domain-containing protein [Streptomyces shenzhenensis]RMB82157.1 hypothetical protein CTZ28_30380 [Streptomyces shenzhenensis]